jgi:hypothetical protein
MGAVRLRAMKQIGSVPLSAKRPIMSRPAWRALAAALFVMARCVSASAAAHAKLVPPREGPDVNTLGVEPDGTRRLIAHGLRALAHPDGAIEVSEEVLPFARGVQVLELPARFGRGFIFWISGSSRASLWKAQTFTGKLTPFAQLDFEADRIVSGFDRIYLQARRTGDWAALEPDTGAGLDRGSLPSSPSYGALAIVDAWFGAVELPIRGVVVSFDAGGSWHALGRGVQLLGVEGENLALATAAGKRLLGADGNLLPVENLVLGGDQPPPERRVAATGPLGSSPLTVTLLRGFAEGQGTAVVASAGALSRVRLSDGRVLETRPRAVPAANDCAAVLLERGNGFVCQEPGGKTRLYAFQPPLGLRLVEAFETPRAVLASGNGGLVIRGGCGPSARDALRSGVHCVRTPAGQTLEVSASKAGTRIVALANGGAAKLVPPDLGAPGALILVAPNGSERSLPLVIKARDETTRSLLSHGFWTDAWVQRSDRNLSGWVVGQGSFMGVRVDLDGHVHTGPLRRSIERALLAGERALVLAAPGVAEQSVDGGATFTDVDLPAQLELEGGKVSAENASLEQGCSPLGCVFSNWLRVGWDGIGGSEPLQVAAAPRPTSLPQPGGGRWILRCALSGEVSPPSVVRSGRSEEGQAPWLGLYEQPPPTRPRDAVGFDTGGEGDLRAYVWAPKGADYAKAGRFLVTAWDAFRVRGGIWSTLPTPSPWADSTQVAEVFGYEGSTPSAWHLVLDPSGRSGVLSVSARGNTDLFAVEENRAATALVSAGRQGIGSVTSAVRIGGTYYVGALEDPRTFRVFALEGSEARLIGQYADLAQGRGSFPALVRSVRGDALGIWTRGAGWYVFPVDLATGATGPAVELRPPALSHLPRVCLDEEQGYLLEGPVGIEPYVEFGGDAERVAAHAYEGRFVVSEQGVCVAALSAQSDGAIDRRLRPQSTATLRGASVPLVIQDHTERGRRWGFRCTD